MIEYIKDTSDETGSFKAHNRHNHGPVSGRLFVEGIALLAVVIARGFVALGSYLKP